MRAKPKSKPKTKEQNAELAARRRLITFASRHDSARILAICAARGKTFTAVAITALNDWLESEGEKPLSMPDHGGMREGAGRPAKEKVRNDDFGA